MNTQLRMAYLAASCAVLFALLPASMVGAATAGKSRAPAETVKPTAQPDVERSKVYSNAMRDCLQRATLAPDAAIVTVRTAGGRIEVDGAPKQTECIRAHVGFKQLASEDRVLVFLRDRAGTSLPLAFDGTRREWNQCERMLLSPATTWPKGTRLATTDEGKTRRCVLPDGDWHGPSESEGESGTYCRSRRHGFGKSKVHGVLSRGRYFLDLRHGEVETRHDDGKPKRRATYRFNKCNGLETSWYRNDSKALEGRCETGRREGLWRIWHPDGALEAEGSYERGRPVGTWTYWTIAGEERTRRFVDGVAQGFCPKGTRTVARQRERAFFQYCALPSGERSGPYLSFSGSGARMSEGEYRRDKKHGRWREWVARLHWSVKEWRNGSEHGISSQWTDGVETQRAYMRNGRLQGRTEGWHFNGQLASRASYINSKLDGGFQLFYPDGAKQLEARFRGGKRDGRWQAWYANGQQRRLGHYRNDEQVGQWRYWTKDGRVFIEGSYRRGKKNGTWTMWHDSEHKSIEGKCVEGEVTGEWQRWDAGGALQEPVGPEAFRADPFNPCQQLTPIDGGLQPLGGKFPEDF